MRLVKCDVLVVSIQRKDPVRRAFHDGLQIGVDGLNDLFKFLSLGDVMHKYSYTFNFFVIVFNGVISRLDVALVSRVIKFMFCIVMIAF